MEDISKIVESLENSGLLLKEVSATVQNHAREQERGFLGMLLGKLGASLIGNILAGKWAIATSQGRGVHRAGKGWGINRAGEGIIRGGYRNKRRNN